MLGVPKSYTQKPKAAHFFVFGFASFYTKKHATSGSGELGVMTIYGVLMKRILLTGMISVFSVSASAERFDGVEREVEQVAGYSQNASYDQNHCIINFTADLPSACDNKIRGVVYLDKEVGQFMCSVALTSLVSSKKLVVSSFDDCDPIHKSPVLRWVGVKN